MSAQHHSSRHHSSQTRRQRLHDLLLALIAQQGELTLMDEDVPEPGVSAEPARWLDRNRRTLQRYQALVRTAVTLDALLDAEHPGDDNADRS